MDVKATKQLPRVLIAGTSSGSGKTTAVCAVLALLKRRGAAVASCKCGPDYIDPMFHESVLGIKSTNLDPFFLDENMLRYLLAENGNEVSVSIIEGVMGYYDGTGADGMENSTFAVARSTAAPVVLVVNGKGASTSLLAVIEGFLNFTQDSMIRGVIFNNISAAVYANLKSRMESKFGKKLNAIGYIPKLPEECILASRHLGLVTAAEIQDLRKKLDRIADICAETIDINALLETAQSAKTLDYIPPAIPKLETIHLAIAKDKAFCFYYKDTFSLFEKMGAVLSFFSPLNNECVPKDADGMLIGGGYPELYADVLEKNAMSRISVLNAVQSGMPTIAECGGFQYLGQTLEGRKMCGVLPHSSYNCKKLVRFGYVSLTSHKDNIFGNAGTHLAAHEFHYYDSTDNGSTYTAVKTNGRSYDCAFSNETLYAGYPHLFLYANIQAAESFYKECLKYRRRKDKK